LPAAGRLVPTMAEQVPHAPEHRLGPRPRLRGTDGLVERGREIRRRRAHRASPGHHDTQQQRLDRALDGHPVRDGRSRLRHVGHGVQCTAADCGRASDDWYWRIASKSASAILSRYDPLLRSFASCGFVTNEISASTLGIEAPISTTNGACLTPRFLTLLFAGASRATSACWTRLANCRDSSSLLFSAIAFTRSGSAPIAWPEAAFSRAATAAALRLFAKFRT